MGVFGDVTPTVVWLAARHKMWSMNRDKRPVVEQVKSGFRIVGKMLVAFAIAVTFMAGCELIRGQRNSQIVLGWVLIMMSILVMTTTVRFWAAGFFGFIAYGALRSLGGIVVSDAFHVSRLYMVVVSVSAFAMAILSHRFTSRKLHIRPIDRASIVIAAGCVLLTFLFGDTYKGIAVFNAGNLSLLVSWWAARISKHNPHKSHAAPSMTA
jgi:hypothetical protein